MAVGKLTVTPETLRGIPSGFDDASFFVGCYVQETEKHRTHSENGSCPYWKNSLVCNVPEGENYLKIELVNENPRNGGIAATAKIALKPVFEQGKEERWVQMNSSSGQSFGELKLNLSFSGTHSVGSVAESFGEMNLGGQNVTYQQKSSYTHSTSHYQSSNDNSRQSSFASLGPANPIPQNYGTGNPPPFTPPAAVSYPGKNASNLMPGSPGSSTPLMNEDGVVNPEKMSEGEFEEAKARGKLPSWAKYGGGALAGLAAVGLTAWGAHELKEHFDKKEEEEEKHKQQNEHKEQEKPFVPPPGYLQPESNKQQPYTIHNQQQQQHATQQHQYPQPPQQHFEKKEHKKSEHHKKEKKHKKHGSDSDSSSSSSDSDDSDDEKRKGKKEKHHKKKDNEWR